MNKLLVLSLFVLSSCTYSITLVHTEGTATDVVDTSQTPTADVDTSIPAI